MNSPGWNINPTSGDYTIENGQPKNVNTLDLPCYYRLKTKRKQWLYAPDDKYGSDFFKILKRTTNQGNGIVESVASRALQPLVDSGRAQSVTVTTTQTARHGVAMKVDIIDAEGNSTSREFSSLGV